VPRGVQRLARHPRRAGELDAVLYTEKGKFPEVFVSYLASPCYQCAEPVCATVCPPAAISKGDGDGIVAVNTAACLGNEACDVKCLKACPYKAPQFGPAPGAKMRKCDFCQERWAEGKLPVCVEACPTRALDAGPLESLRAKYGQTKEAEGSSTRGGPSGCCLQAQEGAGRPTVCMSLEPRHGRGFPSTRRSNRR